MKSGSCFAYIVLGWFTIAFAHQPVMDMAPRWAGGSGFQLRYEMSESDERLNGAKEVANPLGREKLVQHWWLEGVYTVNRSLRYTVKIPYSIQYKEDVVDGQKSRVQGEGFGDPIVAMPLKKYWNLRGMTMNLGLTPQVRMPLGSTSDAYPVGDGSWDTGLSVSFSTEDPFWYTLFDVFYWWNQPGDPGQDQGNLVGLDINLGIHPIHNNATESGMFLMWDLSARAEDKGLSNNDISGGKRITTGPIFILYRGNLMWRSEAHIPVYEESRGEQYSRGILYTTGVGITF